MAIPLSFTQRLKRKFPRVTKSARHWTRALAAGGRPNTRVVFVVGAQRSGTRLPLQVIDHAPEISTFSEGADPYFNDVLLRPLDEVEALVRRSSSPIVALKPICETHRIQELLDRFPASRAIWIFRNYQDTVNSTSVKWTSGKSALRRIARREFPPGDWRVGGLTESKLQLVARLYRDEMSLHEANAVMWYLRNALFFDLQIDERSDVMLVRYEDLVAHPREQFAKIFAFIDTPVPTQAINAIKSTARATGSFPAIAGEVKALCEEIQERLIRHYDAHNKESLPIGDDQR
jgi:hypothetical protein